MQEINANAAAEESSFAPPERASAGELSRQVGYFAEEPSRFELLDAVPDVILILNKNRQTVFANRALLRLLGIPRRADVYGLRPGELLSCIHVKERPAGCGTAEACCECGAVRAIVSSLEGKESVYECRITQDKTLQAFDFRVWGTPFQVNGEAFSIFALKDIADEKRREALERIFFHDILNTAGSLRGLAELLHELTPEQIAEDKLQETIPLLAKRLIHEIESHRLLLQAEKNSLKVQFTTIELGSFLTEIADLYRANPLAQERAIVVDPANPKLTFVSDPILLARVLGNMIKNALEACAKEAQVTINCRAADDQIEFSVHNPSFMPREVQRQIFTRSFSTKGHGRGTGTYSIKLLTERYLGGTVSFTSIAEAGTTFYASIPAK